MMRLRTATLRSVLKNEVPREFVEQHITFYSGLELVGKDFHLNPVLLSTRKISSGRRTCNRLRLANATGSVRTARVERPDIFGKRRAPHGTVKLTTTKQLRPKQNLRSLLFQNAHVASFHSSKARSRRSRW